MASRGPVLVCLALALGLPTLAAAEEPWLLSLEPSFQTHLGAPYRAWYRPGAGLALSLRRALGRRVLVGGTLRAGVLADGPAPAPETGFADPGVGTLSALTLHARLRLTAPEEPARGTGLWFEGGGGVALTGELWRPLLEAGIGYGVPLGRVDLAPVARYLHVVQPNGQLEGSDGHLLLVGLELTFFDARHAPPEPPPPPPGDRDHDGYVDPEDGCPDAPEDFDDFEDEDGCPDPDNDADGILDADDQCPLQPEDRDDFEDEDGCPDLDNDADGILDADDQCPLQPETLNGVEDEDGCPDEGLIEMIDDRIVLEEAVLFDFERARVKSRARPVIRAIVELVRQHPEWLRMRIEGHADVRGNEAYNQRLSERRARNVMRALVAQGLPAELLVYEGFGSRRPRAQGRSERAHQLNRRVEFVVVEQRTQPSAPTVAAVDAPQERPETSDAAESETGEPGPEGPTPATSTSEASEDGQ